MSNFVSYRSIEIPTSKIPIRRAITFEGPLSTQIQEIMAMTSNNSDMDDQSLLSSLGTDQFRWSYSGASTLPYSAPVTLQLPVLQRSLESLQAASLLAASAILWALSKVGRPYVWGAKGQNDTFDCSGLVYAAYKALGKSVPTSTAAWKASDKQKVDKYNGKPGDVIILNTNGPSRGHAMLITENLGGGKYKVVEAKGKQYGVVTSTYTVNSNLSGIYRAKKGIKLIKKK